jgi:hypothetical protein
MTAAHNNRASFQGGIDFEYDAIAINNLNFLKAIYVHSFAAKNWILFCPSASVFEIFGDNKKVHVRLIDAFEDFGVVKPTMHEKELHHPPALRLSKGTDQ